MIRGTRTNLKGGPIAAPSVIETLAPRTGAAIGLVLLGFVALTLMDALAKLLGERGYDPLLVVWARFAINAGFVTVLYARSLPRHLQSHHPRAQVMRSLAQLAAIASFFFALRYATLAQATALGDLNPVLVTLGAALFLGERLGIHRIFGIVAAFGGALIILRPGFGDVSPGASLALVAAASFAAGMLLTRHVRRDSNATSQIWAAYIGTAVSSLALPFVWQPIALADLWIFGLLGLAGTVSQALLIRAYALAEAGVLAPFGYSGLIFASLWGVILFGQWPDQWTILGALVIVGAGLYVWSRERASSARRSDPEAR